MKIAAYNVENLFQRPKAFNQETATSQKLIKATAALNELFEKPNYSSSDKTKMIDQLKILGLLKSDNGKFAILRKIRGRILRRPRNGNIQVAANGREDWVGWVELKKESVNETAVLNTGRVLKDVDADIFAVIEAENRVTLKMFSDQILKKIDGKPYPNTMLIDGNDTRGIDVGVMTKKGYHIKWVRSHIDDLNSNGKKTFSRDCPEYCIETPEGEDIWILPNHYKSKYGGDDPESRERRKNQAKRTAEIYSRMLSEGKDKIIILGDFNDTPDSDPLEPLLKGTDLKDVSEHPSFDTGEFAGTGTYGLGNDSQKIDYLLLSPNLFNRVTKSGLFRKGAWPGSRPKRWEVYPELKRKIHVASDHHVIWCEIS